jgi:hypothetical protein
VAKTCTQPCATIRLKLGKSPLEMDTQMPRCLWHYEKGHCSGNVTYIHTLILINPFTSIPMLVNYCCERRKRTQTDAMSVSRIPVQTSVEHWKTKRGWNLDKLVYWIESREWAWFDKGWLRLDVWMCRSYGSSEPEVGRISAFVLRPLGEVIVSWITDWWSSTITTRFVYFTRR